MTASRLLLAAGVALSSALLSLDPTVRADASPRNPPRPAIPALPAPEVAALEPPVAALDAPPPADVAVEIAPAGDRGHRVTLRREGHLVALVHGEARAAGKDWAAVRVGAVDARGGEAALVVETTPLGALATWRGLLSLTRDGATLRARLAPAAPPRAAGAWSGPHHACAAHGDGSGGFAVLCRLRGASRVAAANVTGPRAGDGAIVVSGKEPLVRLDLPRSPDGAEARVIGFVHGRTGSLLRAEAVWVEGEAPTLSMAIAERDQPLSEARSWR
jgi:hypothetical protein